METLFGVLTHSSLNAYIPPLAISLLVWRPWRQASVGQNYRVYGVQISCNNH